MQDLLKERKNLDFGESQSKRTVINTRKQAGSAVKLLAAKSDHLSSAQQPTW